MTLFSVVSLRTAASVHIAKWSPDGEYFATVGKVYNSCVSDVSKWVCGDI